MTGPDISSNVMIFGGNSPGVAVVYAASTRSLAALELAAHLNRSTLLASFVLIPCEFGERSVTTVDRRVLPAHWRLDPPPPELAAIGDAWVKQARLNHKGFPKRTPVASYPIAS